MLKLNFRVLRPQLGRWLGDVSYNEVTPTVIKKALVDSAGSKLEDGHVCFAIPCPNTSKTHHKVYINKVTGGFTCASCVSSGKWEELAIYLKDKSKSPIVAVGRDAAAKHIKDVVGKTAALRTLPTETVGDILTDFRLPVVAVFDKIDVRVDHARANLYFPLENVEGRLAGYRAIGKSTTDAWIKPAITGGLLVGRCTPKPRDVAVLVPTLAAFLQLLTGKLACHVVCLPNGLTGLPVGSLPHFERFGKLVLWVGEEVTAWESARTFARKLGEKRCLFVRPDKHPLPTGSCGTDQDFKSAIESAEPVRHKSITTFASLRADVLSELQNVDKVHGVKWERFPGLSRLLKGHRRGEVTVVTGPTGCGKTTFVSEYSLDLAVQGVATLWGSFEIRNVRLARTMLQQMAGCPLDANLARFDEFADNFERLPIYYMTFQGQQSIKVVMEAIEHAQYVHDIAHVVIDNLQFMMGVGDESRHHHVDRFWKQDVVVAAFRTFATRRNCHVTLVVHPRKERPDDDLTPTSIFGGAKASQEADNILIIQDKTLTSVGGKKYLQVCKNRYSGDLGVLPLDFDKAALSFAAKKRKKSTTRETPNGNAASEEKTND